MPAAGRTPGTGRRQHYPRLPAFEIECLEMPEQSPSTCLKGRIFEIGIGGLRRCMAGGRLPVTNPAPSVGANAVALSCFFTRLCERQLSEARFLSGRLRPT